MVNDLIWLQVFGEPKGQPSRALPDGSMDTTTGQLAGVGMGAAATLLFAHLLKGAALWVPPLSRLHLLPPLPSSLRCCNEVFDGLGELQSLSVTSECEPNERW